MLRLLGVMGRMAIQTANVVAVVWRLRKVVLLVRLAMAAQASGAGLFPRQILEADDLADIAASRHMGRPGSVAGFATMAVFQRGLEVRSTFELVLVHIFMACLAGV